MKQKWDKQPSQQQWSLIQRSGIFSRWKECDVEEERHKGGVSTICLDLKYALHNRKHSDSFARLAIIEFSKKTVTCIG